MSTLAKILASDRQAWWWEHLPGVRHRDPTLTPRLASQPLVQLLYSLPSPGWWLASALQTWMPVLLGRKFVWSWLARPGLLGGKLCGSWLKG